MSEQHTHVTGIDGQGQTVTLTRGTDADNNVVVFLGSEELSTHEEGGMLVATNRNGRKFSVQ